MKDFKVLKVGEPFEPGKTHYPECAKFDFTPSGPALFIFLVSPAPEEVEAIRSGPFRVGFFESAIIEDGRHKGTIIFLLFKFGDLPWLDAPFSIHLAQCKTPAEIEEGLGYGLNIFLIDANTGILRVMRLVGLGTEWSRRFRQAMLEQDGAGFDPEAYDAEIRRMYRMYGTRDLVEMVEFKNWYKHQS
jgi:hypothetical protein